jgi:hypothetical protein
MVIASGGVRLEQFGQGQSIGSDGLWGRGVSCNGNAGVT